VGNLNQTRFERLRNLRSENMNLELFFELLTPSPGVNTTLKITQDNKDYIQEVYFFLLLNGISGLAGMEITRSISYGWLVLILYFLISKIMCR
jgi:hypothetical protein